MDGCTGADTWPRAFVTARAASRHQKQSGDGWRVGVGERESQIILGESNPAKPGQSGPALLIGAFLNGKRA